MTAATRERAIQVVVGANEPTQHSGLIQALQVDGDIVVVGEPAGAAQAVSVVAEIRPDAVILDLDPSDHGSQHAIEQIMADTPTPILILCARTDNRQSPAAGEALCAGVLDAMPPRAVWIS